MSICNDRTSTEPEVDEQFSEMCADTLGGSIDYDPLEHPLGKTANTAVWEDLEQAPKDGARRYNENH